jgi:hypothetical protein
MILTKKIVKMILHFQKEINLIMYIIEFKKINLHNFILIKF